MERSSVTHIRKICRKERLMERLFLSSNTTRNKLERVCLRQKLGDRWKFVRKSEVGSRVSFREVSFFTGRGGLLKIGGSGIVS